MSARFSEPEAAEIDAARGATDRSAWLRSAALIVARGKQSAPPRKPAPQPEAVYVNTDIPEPERKPKNCKHPNFRGVKGVCPDCQEWVTK
jgi:hypothetical protein